MSRDFLVATIAKDATAADVHVSTALGNQGKKKPKLPAMVTEVDVDKADWGLTVPITKVDDSTRTVYGWASVIEKDGGVVTDSQGDQITPDELVKAAHDFMLNSRTGGLMHLSHADGRPYEGGCVVESLVLTKAVQKAMGIDLGKSGWFIGYKVADPEIWALVKGGAFKDFSIGGSGVRVPVED